MKPRNTKTGPLKPLVSKVVDHLIREIVRDRLRPNQKISEVAVAETLGVSRSPVREALRILERDGLVTYEPGKGVHVTDVRPQEAEEFYMIHGHLMGLAVKLACQKMLPDDVSQLESLVVSLKSAAQIGNSHDFLETRANIEKFIAVHSFSPRLAHLLEIMAYPSVRYRTFHVSVPGYMTQVAECYEGIINAFRLKDDRKAEELREKIIRLGMEMLRRYFIQPALGSRDNSNSA